MPLGHARSGLDRRSFTAGRRAGARDRASRRSAGTQPRSRSGEDEEGAGSVRLGREPSGVAARGRRWSPLGIVASNAVCRALYSPMFDSDAASERDCANLSRYLFLDPGSRDFFVDWEAGGYGRGPPRRSRSRTPQSDLARARRRTAHAQA
ncbi:hypothetical protein ABZ400_30275 [Streptomyces sp. NPDC005897]|uniref:MmyB family transcriptional regulator n=1 Tax=Streptomyces sp. NPDC005897 TaxID=3157081 RepID=UPI0034064F6A